MVRAPFTSAHLSVTCFSGGGTTGSAGGDSAWRTTGAAVVAVVEVVEVELEVEVEVEVERELQWEASRRPTSFTRVISERFPKDEYNITPVR